MGKPEAWTRAVRPWEGPVRWRWSASTALPEIEALQPVPRALPFDDPGFQFEPKYGGRRALLYLRGPAAWFQSSSGRTVPELDSLAWAVRGELHEEIAILDGQVVGLDHDGKEAARLPTDGEGQLHYAAFDVLWRARADLRPRALWSRRRTLEQLIPESSEVLSRVYAVPEQGRALLRAAERLRYRGIVAKRRGDPYREGTVWYVIPTRGPRRSGAVSRKSGPSRAG